MEYDPYTSRESLQATPFFGGLNDAALDGVVALMERRTVSAGTTVFAEGDTGRSMSVVQQGELVVYRQGASGHPVRLLHLHPGDFFGETTLIEMQPRSVTVIAETDAVLLELTSASFYKLYQQNMKSYVLMLQNVNRELCRRLRRAEGRVTQRAEAARDTQTQIISIADLRAAREGRPDPAGSQPSPAG